MCGYSGIMLDLVDAGGEPAGCEEQNDKQGTSLRRVLLSSVSAVDVEYAENRETADDRRRIACIVEEFSAFARSCFSASRCIQSSEQYKEF